MNDELTQTLINVVIKQRNENASRCAELEAKQAVALSSIDVMAKDILSPQILKERSERDGAVEMRLRSLETQLERVHRMHNGTHPPSPASSN